MKVYNTTQFEKLNINKINVDDLKNGVIDNNYIKLDINEMKFSDLMFGDIAICKNKAVLLFVPKPYIENIIELYNCENEHSLFISISPIYVTALSYIPGSCYEKTFPKHREPYPDDQAYNIVEVFRLFEKPDLNKFSKQDFIDFLKNTKNEIEHCKKHNIACNFSKTDYDVFKNTLKTNDYRNMFNY